MSDTAPRTRVLLVDDSTIVRRYIRDALERAEFAVEEAINGVAALEKILVQSFDLLVVDVNMPKMDGYAFLRALRGRTDAHAAIPVLMTSTEAKPRDFAAAEAAGANYYLVKPVSQDDLAMHAKALTGRSP